MVQVADIIVTMMHAESEIKIRLTQIKRRAKKNYKLDSNL